jgi:hypothetical protein
VVARRERGYALLITLAVVFLLSVALSLVALSLAVRLRLEREEARSIRVSALCDAALAEALANLAAGDSTGVEPHPFGNGTIGSAVLLEGPGRYRITATASYGGKGRTAVAEVVRDAGGTRVVAWQRLTG